MARKAKKAKKVAAPAAPRFFVGDVIELPVPDPKKKRAYKAWLASGLPERVTVVGTRPLVVEAADGRQWPLKVVLSFGMGVDSKAILARWLTEPASRDFDLEDLVIITAMTGNEFASTGRLVERYTLPMLREHGVRFIQVARGGLHERDGAVVLDDSTAPERLHFEGCFPIMREWVRGATLQTSGGVRKCSQKFKGWVIDKVLRENVLAEGELFVHVVGFNAEEMSRVEKDQVYGTLPGRLARYPLMEWGWGREKCERYIEETVGVPWAKSCCSFCPYAGQGCEKEAVVPRWREEPERAAWAIEVERPALAFNPRMKLYKTKSAEEWFAKLGLHEAIAIADERLAAKPWAVYRLRRCEAPKDLRTDAEKRRGAPPRWDFGAKGAGRRGITPLTERTLSRDEARAELARMARAEGLAVEGDRAVRHGDWETAPGWPRSEEFLVAAPADVDEKYAKYRDDAKAQYDAWWDEMMELKAALPAAA